MKKMSLVVASLLLASNLSAENSFDSAIKAGSISGDVTLYGEKTSINGSADEGFTSGSIGIAYETGEFNGFKTSLGFRANHDFSEENGTDYSADETTKTILHTANISYSNKYFSTTAGRQEIDLEWMGDFHESVVVGITAIADTTVVLGYTNRKATADADAPLEKFEKFATNEGAYVLDVKYEGIEGLVLNPYYYNADKLASWYGLKADYDTNIFGVTLHGAKSDVENSSSDGEILHFEARTKFSGISLNAGYITTDKTAGVGAMDTLGDNISPLEDGNQVYSADADTTYLGLEYEVSGVELAAIYGQTDFGSFKEKELNLTVDYGITDNLSVGLLYLDVNADESNGDSDYDKIALTLSYPF
jgi:hypothetical protein